MLFLSIISAFFAFCIDNPFDFSIFKLEVLYRGGLICFIQEIKTNRIFVIRKVKVMLKKSIIKALFFVMVILSIIMSAQPVSVFADQFGVPYVTKSSSLSYGVKDGDAALVPATANQTAAITTMRNRARYSWVYGNSGSIDYFIKDNAKLTINFGMPYRGVLYEQKGYSSSNIHNREHWLGSGPAIISAINDYVHCPTNNYIDGTDCSSSVCYAWRSVLVHPDQGMMNGLLMSTKNHTSGTPYHSTYDTKKIVLDGNNGDSDSSIGYGDFITRVGQYGQVASNLSDYGNNTKDIVTDLVAPGNYQGNGTIHKRVYKNIQPGDFLVFRRKYNNSNDMYGHAMLVKKVVIIYGEDSNLSGDEVDDGDGIDRNASYVLTNEQTSKWHDCTNILSDGSTEEYRTSWILGYAGTGGIKYTFDQLQSNFYLPYRLKDVYATMVSGLIPEQLSETSINVKWCAQDKSFCSGYVMEYSTDSAFNNCKKITFNNPSQSEHVLKGLKKGEKYYIRMNACYNNGKKTAYSGYNNWVSVDLKDGSLYRANAPDPTKVTQQVYKQYVYDDISYDNETSDDI